MESSSDAAGASPDPNLDGAIHAGLRAAFESESDAELGDSVLTSIEQQSGVHPRVLLRDPGDGSQRVVAPASKKRGKGNSVGRRYEIHGEIAKGGIGVVLKGLDMDLGREVAIKILRNRHSGNPDILRRFVVEAQIGGQLQHPGILPVYDLGVRPDGKPFFTMKLIQGRTLATLLDARPDPTEERRHFLSILVSVCQTVAYAHACGVVHRDLKPSNIMVGAFGEVQVLDWGLSKVVAEGGVVDDRRAGHAAAEPFKVRTADADAEPAHSQPGSVMGTPAYMPPEQARGEVERLDERSDVFSLGAILCEILTGRPPYVGGTPESIRRQAAEGKLEPAIEGLEEADADAELVRITKSSLELQQAARPRDAGVLAEELAAYLTSVEERLRQVELSRTAAEARAHAEGRARRLTVALAGSVLLIMLVGGGGYLFLEQQRQTRLADTSRAVNQAMGEARLQEGKARAALTGDLSSWDLAIAAAKRAEAAATAGEADPATHSEVASLLKAFTIERKQAQEKAERSQADSQVLRELIRIRDAALSDADYAKAFLDYGIDVDALTAGEAASSIRNSSISAELSSFLDPWAHTRMNARNDKSRHWAKLIDIAVLADQDEWRARMRNAVRARDQSALVDLARSAPVQELPAVTLQLLGEALANVREHKTAVDLLKKSQRRHPDDFLINRALAHSLEQLHPPRWQAAVHFRAAAVAIRPRYSQARVDLSIALRKAGDPDAAGAWFDSALAIDKNNDGYFYLSGRLYADFGDPDLALEAVEKVLEATPNAASAWFRKGAILFDKGDHEDALRASQKAIDLAPTYQAYNNLGASLQNLGRLEEAIAAFRSGIEENAHDYMLHYNLGLLLVEEQQRDLKAAISELTKSVELNPYFAESHYQIGQALELMGRWPEAVVEYGEGIRLGRPHDKPCVPDCYNAIGVYRHDNGEFKEAAANFRKAVELRQDFALAHFNLGNALRDHGKIQEAHESYRNALQQDPGFAVAHRAIGWLLFDEGDAEEAILAYQAALHLEPKNPGYLNDLGRTLFQCHRYDEAIVPLRKALSIQPNYGPTYWNLADVLRETGRFGEVLETYRQLGKSREDDLDLQRTSQHLIEDTKPLIELETRLADVISGEQVPVDVRETIELAKVAAMKRLWQASARLWMSAIAADPGITEQEMSRDISCHAANALAMAGSGLGQGRDGGSFDLKTRASWRSQALVWLNARLELWNTLLATGKKDDRKKVIGALKGWKRDPELVGLRDDACLEKLPEPEQTACRAFWTAVNALLAKAGR